MTIFSAIVQEIRVRQWTKNLVVLAGLVFSLQADAASQLPRGLIAFFCFCLLSSAGYLLNDLRDIETDRIHPRKCKRPLAAGRISPAFCWWLAGLFVIIGLGGCYLLNFRLAILAAVYLLLSVTYSLYLKRIVLLDLMVIAIGFVLRAVAGVEALEPRPELSPWLLVCTLFLALFIGVGKRRHERITLAGDAAKHRRTLAEYSPELLDQLVPVVTGSTIIAYSLYTIMPTSELHAPPEKMIITIPFVVYGIFRYLYLVYQKGRGGAPSEILLTDFPLMLNVLLWGITIILILYFR
jgi:4-hydroxybenzoate polyprenyltransferase